MQAFNTKRYFDCRIKNRNGGLEYCGLSKSFGGKVFAVNPSILGETLCVRSSAILAFTIGVCLQEKKDIMMFLQRDD